MAIFEPVPALSDNYIWLISEPSSPTAVAVDPGEAPPLLDILDERNLELAAVLLTHHHADHVGGVAELVDSTQTPVYGPAGEDIPGVDRPLGGGDIVALPDLGLELEVIEVPGHTAGHIAYIGFDFAFVGDTLFAGGCGRIFEGTPEQMQASLSRLAALPSETRVYCAHEYTVSNLRFAREVEPYNEALGSRLDAAKAARAAGQPTIPSTIADELETNPFLRCRQSAVIAAAEAKAGLDLPTAVDVLAVVRGWKDGWSG